MAKGMNGFTHSCNEPKQTIESFKKSLKDSLLCLEDKIIIWDFYVTHNLAGGCSQQITLQDYGWDMKNREKTLKQIETELMRIAGIDRMCCIRSRKIDNTLYACDLAGSTICVEHPRIVLQQKFSLTSDENEKISFAGGGQNRIECLFNHIRNAFAHSNTYFFDSGSVLLEDKDGGTCTGRILVKIPTLIEWIYCIDKEHKYYPIEVEKIWED